MQQEGFPVAELAGGELCLRLGEPRDLLYGQRVAPEYQVVVHGQQRGGLAAQLGRNPEVKGLNVKRTTQDYKELPADLSGVQVSQLYDDLPVLLQQQLYPGRLLRGESHHRGWRRAIVWDKVLSAV